MISMWIDDPWSFSFAPLPCSAMDFHPGMMDNVINCLRTNLWGDSKTNQAGLKLSGIFKPLVFTPHGKWHPVVHIMNSSLHASRCRALGGRRILQTLKGRKPLSRGSFRLTPEYKLKWTKLHNAPAKDRNVSYQLCHWGMKRNVQSCELKTV